MRLSIDINFVNTILEEVIEDKEAIEEEEDDVSLIIVE